MSEFAVVSALGEDRAGIVKDLSKVILECGGNISESKMATLGGEFAAVMLVQGNESTINDIENKLVPAQKDLNLTIQFKRTKLKASQTSSLPYYVEVVSLDHPGIVHEITAFLSSRGVNIYEMETNSYAAAHTGTAMFALSIQVGVPSELNLGKLRGEFLEFCDSLNLDGSIEASR